MYLSISLQQSLLSLNLIIKHNRDGWCRLLDFIEAIGYKYSDVHVVLVMMENRFHL